MPSNTPTKQAETIVLGCLAYVTFLLPSLITPNIKNDSTAAVIYKIGNVTFTVFSEFEPMKSENTIKSRFEKSITSDFTDLTGEIFEDTMAEEYVCSAAGKED